MAIRISVGRRMAWSHGFRRASFQGIIATVALAVIAAAWGAPASSAIAANVPPAIPKADDAPPVTPKAADVPPSVPKSADVVPAVPNPKTRAGDAPDESIPQPPPAIPKRSSHETNSLGMKLILIPAGEFQMGSAGSSGSSCGGENSELQSHAVRITKPFCLGVYPVTQDEYEQVMKTNPSWFCSHGGGKDRVTGLDTKRFPVDQVMWDDAQEFCKRLSAKEKKNYRLPTEAEWEYACRAGAATTLDSGDSCNGSEASDGRAACGSTSSSSLQRTAPVGTYGPNAWGLYDMNGNVFQWCLDWFSPYYYGTSPKDDPPGPVAGRDRVARGAGWDAVASGFRAEDRWKLAPEFPFYAMGFRVVEVSAGP